MTQHIQELKDILINSIPHSKKIHVLEHRLNLGDQVMTRIRELRNYASTIQESIHELDVRLASLHNFVDEMIEEIGGES